MRYRVKHAHRMSEGGQKAGVKVGDVLYPGRDAYGCCNDDRRFTGLDHVAVSVHERGEPFFTIPEDDVERIEDDVERIKD